MASRYREMSLSGIRTIPQEQRKSKVSIDDYARPVGPDVSAAEFIGSLPDQLAARGLREIAGFIRNAAERKKSVIAMIGGHVIKTGCAPLLIDLMERGFITRVAMNGAAAIHDVEMAVWGETSEEVGTGLEDGSFGMGDGAPGIMNPAAREAMDRKAGFGEILGERLEGMSAPNRAKSLLASAWRLRIPCTVHVALGTDIVHQHPGADGAAIGDASLRDFRVFCAGLPDLDGGGVVMNFGSCVIMPEVFLKSLTVVRNLGYEVGNFVTADFDMIRQYRPRVNIVERPTAGSGRGFSFTGSHELMIPLLRMAVLAG